MTKKVMQYSLMALITTFIVQGCKENNGASTPKTEPTASSSFVYKGMIVGSTGHLTVTLTTKDSTKKGTGKVEMTMDGKKHTLTSNSDKLASFKKGEKLDTVKFSDNKGVTATVSMDKSGDSINVDMDIEGHGKVTVSTFKDDENTKVEVFEGKGKTYVGESVTATNPIVKEEYFNLIIKGEKVKVLQKAVSIKDEDCTSLDTQENRDKYLANTAIATGTVKVQGSAYTFTINLKIPTPGGVKDTSLVYKATRNGDKLTSETIVLDGGNSLCVTVKKLDPAKAYPMVGQGKGYKAEKAGSNNAFIRCDDQHGCDAVPAGYMPVDRDGKKIAEGDSTYYINARGNEDKKGYVIWVADKTL